MIRGIGIDIVEVQRFKRTLERFGDRFIEKVFTDAEILYCRSKANPVHHFAARFAAKEAFSKAISTGWSGEFRWKNVEVVNDVSGKPDIFLYGKTAEVLYHSSVFLSLSHADRSVVALVVIENKEV